jgi:hypothetical protein
MHDLPAGRVDEEHPPGLKAALRHDPRGVDVEHTGLAPEDDQPVGGLPPPSGPQAVAIKYRTNDRAVGEGDTRRTIPRLHERRMERVEISSRRVHSGRVFPGFGNHHQHTVGQAAAAQMQELEHLIERSRIARLGRADGE